MKVAEGAGSPITLELGIGRVARLPATISLIRWAGTIILSWQITPIIHRPNRQKLAQTLDLLGRLFFNR